MPAIGCPYPNCTFVTDDVDAVVAAALLTIHNNTHANPTAGAAPGDVRQKAPKIDRPSIRQGSTEENWNAFMARWQMFKGGTQLTAGEAVQQLFQCCEGDLGDNILRSNPDATTGTEAGLLAAIKRLAVTPVAISVRRSDLLSIKQDHGENVRSFYARINGKAATCAYTLDCPSNRCAQQVNFTDIIVKDVLISGLSDDEIRKEVLGWSDLDIKPVKDTVSFIESKEMARDALTKQITAASISQKTVKTKCKNCRVEIERYTWNKRQRKMIEVSLCLPCWRHANPQRQKAQPKLGPNGNRITDEASLITIACTSTNQMPSTEMPSDKTIVLDHHIFTMAGWKQANSMKHPTLQLELTIAKEDYEKFEVTCPQVITASITVVTDTGAQSCLWGLREFYQYGFQDKDLFPVKRTLSAANTGEINISGAIFIRLTGTDNSGNTYTAPVMTYISPDAKSFYLSRHACIQLGIIPRDFPKVGSADIFTIEHQMSPCGCPTRTLPPNRPASLPFDAIPENIHQMREWLVQRYAASTFNRCPHQQLPGMSGPEIRLHVDPNATPAAVHSPASVPLHWQEEVEQQLKDDVSLGVLEEVPIGEPSLWCHRMVLARKTDGTPRRTVDLSPLNKHCLRETHHVKPPYQQAKSIPSMTWKTVTDAWNGYHSVPIHPDDRHLTTFLTPWGRFRYKTAPQGFLASGDGYTRRFDEIIRDVPRKTKCVDDTAMWDEDLEDHWWRVIDFLELLGRNGIVLNESKFQFAQRQVKFAGFEVTEKEIRPLEKFISAIRDFPTPSKLSDVRSWFGLVNQVTHYGKLTDLMVPFKALLSPKSKFAWSDELETAFQLSKDHIIEAIKHGVEIFDLNRQTCLRPDWSRTGIGFFLSQKHCQCPSIDPDCCKDGWKITLAGSRFLKPAESRYAPVEGEALAIAWSLEQTRFFTQGCDNLLIVTDHKPLTKLFGDRTLDEITNPRLFRLKQRTLPWRFKIKHLPGSGNHFSDATSRNPVNNPQDPEEDIDSELSMIVIAKINDIRAVTWDVVKKNTATDETMTTLLKTVESGFPPNRTDLPTSIQPYWDHRACLWTVDGVILMKDRVIIPKILRKDVLETLHAAHQGTTGMNERAKSIVFWPGITNDIAETRARCGSCNKVAPSHPRTPPIEPLIPTTPFEAIACDYFFFRGWYYFVSADRLSGWTEQSRMKATDDNSGSAGLCRAFRSLFSTFGVPIEISSDGGPQFVAMETEDFLRRWGVHHRVSSAYFPSSNGRAELAVKSTKRLLMENVGSDGNLNTDKVVRALLTQRNTPDPISKLSPAQVLFGRPLRDTLPYINKSVDSFTNPQVNSQWRDMWRIKEETMRRRYDKTLAHLAEHSRPLPPLQTGDHVFLQNQTGIAPRKWDRTGMVMEVKPNDQYLIKVSGTGRVTLRNRRFIRKIRQPSPQTDAGKANHPNWFDLPVRDQILEPTHRTRSEETEPTDAPDLSSDRPSIEKESVPLDRDDPEASKVKDPTSSTVIKDLPIVTSDDPMQSDTPHAQPLRRSSRVRKQRLFYDPLTGGATEQNP